jgi:exosortase/archaeosortase family protein
LKKKAKARSKSTPAQPAQGGLRGWIQARRQVLGFILLFGLLMGLYYSLLLIPAVDYLLYQYLKANAMTANLILQALGQSTQLNDVTISSGSHAVSVRRGCDGTEPAWLFAAAVMAYPALWNQRWKAILTGLTLILGLNVFRIVSLFLIRVFAPDWFETAHVEIWPTVFILVAVLLWVNWLQGLKQARKS